MNLFWKILGGLGALIALFALGVYLFGTVDIRTETAKNNPSEAKGKYLLEEMAKAHQVSNWDELDTYTVQFRENMYGFIGKTSNPFPEPSTLLNLSYIPGSYDGRATFMDGPNKGDEWGIQSWKTYQSNAGSEPVFKKHKNTLFWIPTYQYFVEFPKRILKADAVSYAGKKTIDGIECTGVLASWNSIAPQRKIDQYLLWLDSESKQIVKLEYTVRDMYNFVAGAARLKNYKDFDGILLPTLFEVESNLLSEGELLHSMEILGFEKNVPSISELRPNAKLNVMGDEK